MTALQRYVCQFCGQGGANRGQPVSCHNCQRDGMRNAAGHTHTEKAAAVRVARPCSAHDVLAGGQCGNCLWKAA